MKRSSTPPRKWYCQACDESDKRAAITDWKVVKQLDEATLLDLIDVTLKREAYKILTARTRQEVNVVESPFSR